MVKPKKHLGQHFLTDLSIAENLAKNATADTNTIVEVGPGTGVLTQYLIPTQKKILAFEVDIESVEYLNTHFPQENLEVLHQDFLQADLPALIQEEFSVVGNFPYNISSQIVFKILENKTQIPEMVGMFQKEVAERICSIHGNKTYGILSVLTQAFYTTEYLFTVDENVFNPPPKVKSGIIKLSRKEDAPSALEPLLRNIVKAGFGQRRKKLSNALKTLNIPVALENHNFLTLRAEQLSVQDFIEFTKLWNGNQN